MRPNFFYHLHPPTIPAKQARWRYTLGAGGMAVFLVLILVLTGALEMFFYIPTPAEAANSIQTLTYIIPFGGLLRNLHFWSAQFLVIISGVHLIRVVFTGSATHSRRFNYLLGLILFLLIVLIDFTGYILRWDQGIQWALVVGVNLVKSIPLAGESLYMALLGEAHPGSISLIRFYAWHVFGLSLVAIILMVWHIFRVRRDGGIAVPPPALRADSDRISRMTLVRREILAMLLLSGGLIILSIFFPAPIGPGITDLKASLSTASAPWFFLWVQQLLKWGNPFIWGVLIPISIWLVMAVFPYIFPMAEGNETGRCFSKASRPAQIIITVFISLIIMLTLLARWSVE